MEHIYQDEALKNLLMNFFDIKLFADKDFLKDTILISEIEKEIILNLFDYDLRINEINENSVLTFIDGKIKIK